MNKNTAHTTKLSVLMLSILMSNTPLCAMQDSLIDASPEALEQRAALQAASCTLWVRALDTCIVPVHGLLGWLTKMRIHAIESVTDHALLKKEHEEESTSTALVTRPSYTSLTQVVNNAQLMSNIPMFFLGMQCTPYAMFIAAYAFINTQLNVANVECTSNVDCFWDNYETVKKALPAALHQEPPALNTLTEQDKVSAEHTLKMLQNMLAQQRVNYLPASNRIAALAEFVGLGWLLHNWLVHAMCYPGPAMIFGINMLPRMASNRLYAQHADYIALEQKKLSQLAEQIAQTTPTPLYPNVYQTPSGSLYKSTLLASLPTQPSAPPAEGQQQLNESSLF